MKFITARPTSTDEKLFTVKESDKKRTVDELMAESKLSPIYYFMLIFSAVIVVSGILLNHMGIIIAGMLVAPILKPILTFSLGIATFNIKLIYRSLLIVILSAIIIVLVGILLTILYPAAVDHEITDKIVVFNILSFLIAFISGMAATLAWTKKNMLEMLSGVAIAVTVMPPLSLIGIAIIHSAPELASRSLMIFGHNFLTIVLGSVIIFLISRFGARKEVKKEIEKQLKKEEKDTNGK
ncbi:DUF389 domain-containing protein [Patescibacteria group bacterium]|nr:DUF389 domain-containing protein [Patescibacteria group bacterium]